MKSPIDASFVTRWSVKSEGDQQEYDDIMAAVQGELKRTGNISENTFIEIVRWKAARLLGKRGWIGRHLLRGQYKEIYAKRVSAARMAPDQEKIFRLKAPGIDAPVASTILHFMYPSKFPIMDVRTVEVLNHMGYVEWITRSLENYQVFRKVMRELSSETGFSFRKVDQALFAYHKMKLGGRAVKK